MRKHGGVAFGPDAGELLRARGLRVTPQRRAILGAFSHGDAEHLSADEIHARAAAVVPELGRGTVYAALAELTELGLLAARGSPEPVRYETNTEPHQHFRCRLCLRLFDVDLADPAVALAAGLRRRADHDHRGGRLRGVRRLRQGPARRGEAGAPPFVGRPPGRGGRDDRRHAAWAGSRSARPPTAWCGRSSTATATSPRCSRRSTAAAGAGPPASTSPPRRRRSRRTSPAGRPRDVHDRLGPGRRRGRRCARRWPSRARSSPPTTCSTRPRARASAAACSAPTRWRSSSPATA